VDSGIINAWVRGGEGGGNAFSFNSTVVHLACFVLCIHLPFSQSRRLTRFTFGSIMSGTKDIVAANVKAETDDSLSEIDNVNIDKVNPLMPPAILMESLPISEKGCNPTRYHLRFLTRIFTYIMPAFFAASKTVSETRRQFMEIMNGA
jgi:hypothetical protein